MSDLLSGFAKKDGGKVPRETPVVRRNRILIRESLCVFRGVSVECAVSVAWVSYGIFFIEKRKSGNNLSNGKINVKVINFISHLPLMVFFKIQWF